MVVVAVPALVLTFRGIHRHYRRLRIRLDAAAAGVAAAPPFTTKPLVVVDGLDGAAKHGLWLSKQLARGGEVQAVGVRRAGRACALDGDVVVTTSVDPRRLVETVRESVWALPHGGSEFVTVVIPEQFERPSLAKALLRRSFLLKLRLLRESGVAICDVSTLDRFASEELPQRIAVRVLVSDARAASLRAARYAAALGFADTRAVHFAPSGEKGEAMAAAWERSRSTLPLEIVPTAYRDITDPVRAYAHRIVDHDPAQAVLYVIPEIVVTGWRRLLHNFRELHVKHGILFDSPRIMLIAVPYHLR
jgi:hypothetical protein